MKCWRCGASCDDSAVKCPSCGADLVRKAPSSEIGKAMRMLFDRYGADKIFTNNAYLVNGLGDLAEDSRKVRNQLKMAMDAGLGSMYLDQISVGEPDAAFDARVRSLITEEAGLNEKTASEIAGYFDEMIGWRNAEGVTKKKPEEKKPGQTQPLDDFGPEIDRKNPKKSSQEKPKKTGLFVILGLALAAVIFLMTRGGGSGTQETTTATAGSTSSTNSTSSTTTAEAETTAKDREAEEAAEKAAEQEDLKERWVTMHNYVGSGEALMQDDFILYKAEKDEFSIFDFYGVSFLTDGEYFEFARGGSTGLPKAAIEEMYGKPAQKGTVTEDYYVYKYLKDFENLPEDAEAILGDSIYRYEFETERLSCVLDFLFDQETGEVIGYGYNSSKKE